MKRIIVAMLTMAMVVNSTAVNALAEENVEQHITESEEEVAVTEESSSVGDTSEAVDEETEECLTETETEGDEESVENTTEAVTEEMTAQAAEDEKNESCDYTINTKLLKTTGVSLCSSEDVTNRDSEWNYFLDNADSLEAWRDYVPCKYFYSADSKEDAQLVADIYCGDLINYSYGVAEMIIPGYTTEQVIDVCVQTTNDDSISGELPAIAPDYVYWADAEVPEDFEAPMELDDYVELTKNGDYLNELVESDEYEAEVADDFSKNELESLQQSNDEDEKNFDYDLTRDSNGNISVITDNTKETDDAEANLTYATKLGWHHTVNGDYSAWNYATGKGVKVAVLDSGATKNHKDLHYVNASNAMTNYGTSYWARYLGGSYNGVNDNNGHGTHCAGIIAARGSADGAVGVAPDAQLYAIKCLEENGGGGASGPFSAIARAINMAADKKVNVISMSLGGKGMSAIESYVSNAVNRGIIVVCAAGNDSSNALYYPAQCKDSIVISATKQSGSTQVFDTTYSNYGNGSTTRIDFAAPGTKVYSTWLGNSYNTISGTSMATPMVSGAVALYMERNPELLTIKNRSNRTTVFNALKNSATDLGDSGYDNYYGWGAINTAKLVGSDTTFNITDVPKFSIPAGPVIGGYGLKMYSSNGNGTIYYTMDGSEPTLDSLNYVTESDSYGLIYLPEDAGVVTIKAASIRSDGTKTKTATVKYTILPEYPLISECNYTNTTSLGKVGFFKGYYGISSYTSGVSMPYQEYEIIIAKNDKVELTVKTSGFNTELYLFDGSNLLAKDVRDPYLSSASAKNDRKIVYTNTSGSTQYATLVVTSGALLKNQALGRGSATYTLKAKIEKAVTSVAVDLPTYIASKGSKINATASVRPGDAANSKVDWELLDGDDPVLDSVATINNGKIVINSDVIEPKTITVKATSQSNPKASGTASITIYPAVKQLDVINSDVSLAVNGSNYSYNAKENLVVMPENSAGRYSYTSSNSKVARVDNYGIVYAVAPGKATITVKALDGSNKSKSFKVNVSKIITGIDLQSVSAGAEPDSYAIAQGTSDTIKANITPSDATNKKLIYTVESETPAGITCNNGVVKVDSSVAPGTIFVVKATTSDGSKANDSIVYKVYGKTAKVTLNESAVKLNTKTNKNITLNATLYNIAGTSDNIFNKVNWVSSNPKVATVTSMGVVTAIGKGTAVIKAVAADGSKVSAQCKVTVESAVTSIDVTTDKGVITNTDIPVAAGKITPLKAITYPADANNKTVTWSLGDAPSGVTLENGKLNVPYGVDGDIEVIATANDGSGTIRKATCTILAVQASKVTITGDTTTLNTYNATSCKLKATVYPGEAQGGMDGVVWTSSNPKVAEVDSDGRVYAVAKGTVKITATASDGSGNKAVYSINVIEPIMGLSITSKTGCVDDSNRLILVTGKNNLVAKIEYPKAPSDKRIVWSISGAPSGVTIDSKTGAVTVRKGFSYPALSGVNITATVVSTGISYSRSAVIYPATTKVMVPKYQQKISLGRYDSVYLYPSSLALHSYGNRTGNYFYKSSNPKVAEVDSDGRIVALSPGKVTITITSADGMRKSTSVKVTVYK